MVAASSLTRACSAGLQSAGSSDSEVALVVERGQPVHALDRPRRLPLARVAARAPRPSGAPSMVRTSAPSFASRLPSASATPPRSGISTTRLPSPSFTPVSTQTSSGGRTTGSGTRRGIRYSASATAAASRRLGGACPRRARWRRSFRRGLRGLGRAAGGDAGPVADEPDDVVEGRVVAQLERLVELDPVGLADRGEHLGLLDGVDAEIGLEVEIHVEQLGRIAGLLGHHRRAPASVTSSRRHRRPARRRRGRWPPAGAGCAAGAGSAGAGRGDPGPSRTNPTT